MQWEIDTKHTKFSAKSYHSFLLNCFVDSKGFKKCVYCIWLHIFFGSMRKWCTAFELVCVDVFISISTELNASVWIWPFLPLLIEAMQLWACKRARRQLFIRLGRMLDCVRVSQTKCNYCDECLKGNHIISFTCTAAAAASIYFDPFANVSEYESLFIQMKLRLYLFKTHYQLASYWTNRMRCTRIKRHKMPLHGDNDDDNDYDNDDQCTAKKMPVSLSLSLSQFL